MRWPLWYGIRAAKCDETKNKTCELMGFIEIIREIKTKNVSFLKISMLVQIVGVILPQFCFNDSIQILLKMAWFLTLGTKPISKGFVSGHQSLTVAICRHRLVAKC